MEAPAGFVVTAWINQTKAGCMLVAVGSLVFILLRRVVSRCFLSCGRSLSRTSTNRRQIPSLKGVAKYCLSARCLVVLRAQVPSPTCR